MAENRVRWKVGSFELEVAGDDAFIAGQVDRFFKLLEERGSSAEMTSSVVQIRPSPASTEAEARQAKELSPAEYIRQKKPESGTDRLVVLAKYLEANRGQSEFSRKEINQLANEAKLKDIHSQYFTYAVEQGLLRTAGKNKYAITLSGEDLVLRLPKGTKQEA